MAYLITIKKKNPPSAQEQTMARKPRNLLSESYYHITQKCNYDAFLFEDTAICVRYLALLTEVFVKYGLPILAYCLMKNHIHLLTREILQTLFNDAGCKKLKFDEVNNHRILFATL